MSYWLFTMCRWSVNLGNSLRQELLWRKQNSENLSNIIWPRSDFKSRVILLQSILPVFPYGVDMITWFCLAEIQEGMGLGMGMQRRRRRPAKGSLLGSLRVKFFWFPLGPKVFKRNGNQAGLMATYPSNLPALCYACSGSRIYATCWWPESFEDLNPRLALRERVLGSCSGIW